MYIKVEHILDDIFVRYGLKRNNIGMLDDIETESDPEY